jgi:hypothetical protein
MILEALCLDPVERRAGWSAGAREDECEERRVPLSEGGE